MKRLTLLLLILLIQCPQYGWSAGRLIVGKDTLDLMAYPLMKYFEEKNISKEDIWGADSPFIGNCYDTWCYSACYPTFKIKKNKLYLEKIDPCCYDGDSKKAIPKADLKKLFPKNYKNGRVFINWENDELLTGKGHYLFANLEGFRIYGQETGYFFKKGKLQKIRIYDNSKTKPSPYVENDKLLRDFIYSTIRWNEIKSALDSTTKSVFCRIISTKESGQIDSVAIFKGASEIVNREAIRVIKSIPQWEVLHKKGIPYERQWSFVIKFDLMEMEKYSH